MLTPTLPRAMFMRVRTWARARACVCVCVYVYVCVCVSARAPAQVHACTPPGARAHAMRPPTAAVMKAVGEIMVPVQGPDIVRSKYGLTTPTACEASGRQGPGATALAQPRRDRAVRVWGPSPLCVRWGAAAVRSSGRGTRAGRGPRAQVKWVWVLYVTHAGSLVRPTRRLRTSSARAEQAAAGAAEPRPGHSVACAA